MPEPLYPLRFEPIFKTNLWGGTRLRPWLGQPPSDEPTGEAWILSDVDGNPSVVSNGPLAGRTLRDLMEEYGRELLGAVPPVHGRFPLLLKFIDARQELSVQVHPTDEQARAKDPRAVGKTEAWVVIEAQRKSRIYAGFQPGMTEAKFRAAMKSGTVPATLHQFAPSPGDCVFLRAGTIHAIGAGIMLFEVQQTSDITYRLYDWDRVDAKTGKPREMHIDDGLACSNFTSGPCRPVVDKPSLNRGRLVVCDYFALTRYVMWKPREFKRTYVYCQVFVVLTGRGTFNGELIEQGEVILIPPGCPAMQFVPEATVTLLHVAPVPDLSK